MLNTHYFPSVSKGSSHCLAYKLRFLITTNLTLLSVRYKHKIIVEMKGFFSSPIIHPSSYPVVTEGAFLEGKAAGTWSWKLTSIYCRG